MKRCFGNGLNQELYARYHDEEWAVPVHEDQRLFEMLILEGAQAGLSWETILKRREGYREAFHQFDLKKTSLMEEEELEKLMHFPGIIRNRRKIWSVRQNSLVFQKIQQEFGSFDTYLWRFVKGVPIVNARASWKEVPSRSSEGDALSKDLKKRGMTFVGPTIIYAYMQAVGMVDDHLLSCPKKHNCCA